MDALVQAAQHTLQSSAGVILTLVGFVVALLKLFTAVGKGLDMHNDYFVEKRLKRLRALQADGGQTPRLERYLADSVETEAFRIATGISTSPRKMLYLMKLAATGRWDRWQLAGLSKHLVLHPEDDEPVIRTTSLDRLGAWSSLLMMSYCLLVALACIPILPLVFGWPGLLLGVFAFVCAVAAAPFLARDYLHWKIAQRAVKYLARNPVS